MHPWNILLLCLVTKILQISSTSISRSWCKCMSASPDNRSSDILFRRYDLIRRKPENERSAKLLCWGTYPHQHILHTIRFPGSCKVGVYFFQKYCHSFNSERREDGVGISCCQNWSFSVKLRRLSCFTTADGTKEKISAPSLLSSLNRELISSNKWSIKGMVTLTR